ncbi:MAG TPA: hypothetical protein VL197_10300 [Nitrospirota bacterium]|nr:hypothetical protein [Nitrospirota bacterium]
MKGYAFSTLLMIVVLSGCHTAASFILPPDTDLMINGERVVFNAHDEEGRSKLERRPFFWNSIAGIQYTLLQDDKIIKKDKLPSGFRITSIFWPPYAYIYWPVGFRFACYDLSDPKKEFVEKCTIRDGQAGKMESHPSTTMQ